MFHRKTVEVRQPYSSIHKQTAFKIPVDFHHQPGLASTPCGQLHSQGGYKSLIGALRHDNSNAMPDNQPECKDLPQNEQLEIAENRQWQLRHYIEMSVLGESSQLKARRQTHDKKIAE